MKNETRELFVRLEEIKTEVLREHPGINKEQLRRICSNNKEYARIREEIYMKNSRLVNKVLSDMQRGNYREKYSEEDLIEAGNEEMLRTIDEFKISKNTQFSTYAYACIRGAIHKEMLQQKKRINIPEKMITDVRKALLQAENNGQLTLEEIRKKTKYKDDEILLVLGLLRPQLSLNDIMDSEDEVASIIPSPENIEEDYEEKEKKEMLQKFLESKLTEQELKMISLRFGLNGDKAMTLDEVARELSKNITKERMRQQINAVLRKLKDSPEKDMFAVYMDKPDAYETVESEKKNSI